MTDGKDQSPVRRPVVVAAILLVAVALLLVALRWSLENELVADLPVAGEQEASAPVPQAEPQVEPAADPPSVDSVAAISPPLIQAMVPLKVILLPARSDDPDPAAAILADEIRQQTLGALRRMENIDVVDVGPAEFAAVVPASAGPLWTDRQVYLAISRQYGGVSAAEIAVESSEDTTRWESRLAVVRERGSLNAGAGVSKNGAASPRADIESIGLKYAE